MKNFYLRMIELVHLFVLKVYENLKQIFKYFEYYLQLFIFKMVE